jgi:hypothetical protein
MNGNILATLWPAMTADHEQSIFCTDLYARFGNKNLKANIHTQG